MNLTGEHVLIMQIFIERPYIWQTFLQQPFARTEIHLALKSSFMSFRPGNLKRKFMLIH